jgi:hypothetical protein
VSLSLDIMYFYNQVGRVNILIFAILTWNEMAGRLDVLEVQYQNRYRYRSCN